MNKRTVAIIHFNTPELTEAAILSLRKHGGEDYQVIVFDNSADITIPPDSQGNGPKETLVINARPFKKKMKGVKIIDNTKGQQIDFDKFLAGYPDRNARLGVWKSSVWGSAKHIRTVQWLWDNIKAPFILMESDTLLKRDINEMWREEYSFVGYVQKNQHGNKFKVPRILPFLCFMNVPKFVAEGCNYFDPNRCYGLKADENDRGNWYDTGATILEDVLTHRPKLKGLHMDIRIFILHYGGGSWHQNDLPNQQRWLETNKALWYTEPASKPQTAKRANSKKD